MCIATSGENIRALLAPQLFETMRPHERLHMKKHFHQFYVPTKTDLEQLWTTCLFCFDANVLLNLYHYSKPTQDAFLNVLTSLGDRIWLPHQAGFEYQQLRCNIILRELTPYNDITANLRRIEETLKNSPAEHPFVKPETVTRFKRMATGLLKELTEAQEALRALLKTDPILDRLTVLFDSRTGDPYSAERLKEIAKDGDARNDAGLPPGYCDKGKDLNKYGDLIIWMQILDKAKAEKRGIIFVTNDEKPDWWNKRLGGPRSELRSEMKSAADAACYFYTATDFVEQAKDYLKEHVKDEVIREMKEAAEERRRYEVRTIAGVRTVVPRHFGYPAGQVILPTRTAAQPYPPFQDPDIMPPLGTEVPVSVTRHAEFSMVNKLIEQWCAFASLNPTADEYLRPNLKLITDRMTLLKGRWYNDLSIDLQEQFDTIYDLVGIQLPFMSLEKHREAIDVLLGGSRYLLRDVAALRTPGQ
jgi:hypothetical protein